jgi:hypothetical protein
MANLTLIIPYVFVSSTIHITLLTFNFVLPLLGIIMFVSIYVSLQPWQDIDFNFQMRWEQVVL